MVEPEKLALSSGHLVIWELPPDHDGSLKIGVGVTDDWSTWESVLSSLGYQVLQIHSPESSKIFLQVGTLSGGGWLLTNQVRRLSNLKDT